MKVTCKQCDGHVYAPWILRHESPEEMGPGRTVDYVLDAGVFCSATCLTKCLEPVLEEEAVRQQSDATVDDGDVFDPDA